MKPVAARERRKQGTAVSNRRSLKSRRPETAATKPKPTITRKRPIAKWDHAEFLEWKRSLPEGIERDTLLVPLWIAESVCQEVSCYLNMPTPIGLVGWLDRKARICYEGNEHFRKTIRRPVSGRDWLFAYMRHWTAGWYYKNRWHLYQRLPKEFANGKKLAA